MGDTARDVMTTRFFTLGPEATIAQAVRVFRQASQETGQRVFGLMVTEGEGRLKGMLSMYDILLLIRPKHIHIWGEMTDLELDGLFAAACRRGKGILVGDIMTTDLITVTPDTHLLLIIDIMIKKHVRRIPVLEDGRVLGLVYLSTVFDRLLDRLAGAG
ncbi:MAG: signal transduction protein [Deltaproteobacteria bacterium RBG_13_58_19]|nr:MAG: signal transduction protein [Deltaproteobacteria bacterium RBG_13_58_19]